MLQLREGERAGLLDAPDGGDAAEADCHRDGLVGLEQQRREASVVAEAVAAGGAADGLDGVAELAQALDVLAHGALADAEERGQLGPGRRRPHLQVAEEGEQPGGRLERHGTHLRNRSWEG